MSEFQEYYTANKKLWDAKTPAHVKSEFYEMDAFLNGKNVLREIELAEMPDVKGKSLLHLQCHFGQDTLCWSRMGAKCTGVDFSSKAIQIARETNENLALDAQFIEANVMELDSKLDEKFDIIYTSYGALCWLPELRTWAKNINKFLKPGGVFFIAEFHPSLYMLEWDNYKIAFNYFNRPEPDHELTTGTYADENANIQMDEYFWSHSMEEIIMNLLGEGLQLESFKEYPWSPFACFPNVEKVGENRYKFKNFDKEFPYTFSMRMNKTS